MKTKISEYMNINRIEFFITHKCGGKCKHCQSGTDINKESSHNHVIAEHAVTAVEKLVSVFDVTSVMTFGGEPLYYADVVLRIHKKAKDCGIEVRQIITSGFFTNNAEVSKKVAFSLFDAGVNSLLISVDGLHQEVIPIEPVFRFVEDVIEAKIPNAFLYPAWAVSENHSNPFNYKTKKVIEQFSDLPIPVENNIIDLTGSAAQFLSEYYNVSPLSLSAPCLSEPCSGLANVDNIGIDPNGDVVVCGHTIGNIYTEDILDIIRRYNPHENECMSAIMSGGFAGLLACAEKHGVTFDISKYYSVCWVACNTLTECISAKKPAGFNNLSPTGIGTRKT